MQLFRVMIAPAILPDILTAWKVNLGNASRVVVVAELVGATGGVGYQLQQQQVFDMAGAATNRSRRSTNRPPAGCARNSPGW
jgi:NitT/TauT family transport system permease protein